MLWNLRLQENQDYLIELHHFDFYVIQNDGVLLNSLESKKGDNNLSRTTQPVAVCRETRTCSPQSLAALLLYNSPITNSQ